MRGGISCRGGGAAFAGVVQGLSKRDNGAPDHQAFLSSQRSRTPTTLTPGCSLTLRESCGLRVLTDVVAARGRMHTFSPRPLALYHDNARYILLERLP